MKSPQDCRQVHFSVLKIQIYCKVVTCGCLYLPSLSHCHLFSAHNMFCFSYVYSHVSFWAIQKCVCRKISNIEKRPLFLTCDSDDNTKSCLWPTQFNLPEPCNKSTTAELSHCWHVASQPCPATLYQRSGLPEFYMFIFYTLLPLFPLFCFLELFVILNYTSHAFTCTVFCVHSRGEEYIQ